MRTVLLALGRVLGVQVALRATDGLSPGQTRVMLAMLVAATNLAPIVAVLTGTISYGDVWLWLAIEVITIYAWTLLRLVRLLRSGGNSVFAAGFFGFHYGMFALVPFLVGMFTVLPWSPLRAPWLTVLVLGGIGFVAYGWSVRGLVRDRAPVGIWGFVQAYARMMLAYFALFAPMVATGQNEVSDSQPLTASSPFVQAVVAVCVLVAKLVLELLLVVGVERRADGRTYLLGKPVVVKVQRPA
ncbi:DUF6498-containing protein [Oryzobacter telluris]|uniref:DUF6498-containing protein n=1 Tax=Oryzobacter telluris TaxID=3149179 RepID=UPI00370DA402